jgi:hypothetical protein
LYNTVQKKRRTMAMVLRLNPLNVAFRRSLVETNLHVWQHLVTKFVNVQHIKEITFMVSKTKWLVYSLVQV